MASEWIDVTLGDVLTLQRGFDLPADKRVGGTVPVVASTGPVGFHNEAKVEAPGVLIGRSGSIGGGQYLKTDFWPLNTTLWVKDFKGNNPRYCYYLLKTLDLAVFNAGSGVPTLNRNHIHPVPVRKAPLAEQKAIAHILGTLDDKIELNRKMNETLEAMAQALFKSWFVDFDPVIDNALAAGNPIPEELAEKAERRKAIQEDSSFKSQVSSILSLFPDSFQPSELGLIPSGWETVPLYDTARYINGAAFKNADFCADGEGLPVIKIAELKDGIGPQTKWSLRQAGPDQLIDTGDLIYSWSGSPDTSLDAFLWSNGRGLLNQHIFKVVAPTIARKHFVYYLLKHMRPVLVATAKNKQTTGLGHVTVADMKRLRVCFPSKDVLAAFDIIVGPIFDKAFANTLESRTLAALRDALLPKLLSGELRIPEVEKMVGAPS